jgi:hypothetical protein
MSGFAPDRLDDPEGFARELRETLRATLEPREGRYDLDVTATITWGRVLDRTSSGTTFRQER